MKTLIKESIYKKVFKGTNNYIRFSDLPKDIQENDIIVLQLEDDFYSENNSYEAYTMLEVYREREETDEEYENRISSIERYKEQSRKRRYENYLKLKEEFES